MNSFLPLAAENAIFARLALRQADFSLDVDLCLPALGVTALFGPSGAGKTTLLRCLAGLNRAAGHLRVKGECWQDDAAGVFLPAHRRPLGMVFQDARLFRHLTVRGNLEYGWRRLPAAQRPLLSPIIDLLGLQPLLPRLPADLSGGEAQRVAIGRALAVAPQLLLLDEPLAALDLAKKREILPYLEALRDTLKLPLVYVSHAGDEVARLADQVVMLKDGRVLCAGDVNATLARVDLTLPVGEDLGVVLQGRVAARDESWGLAQAAFTGGALWLRDEGLALGQSLRVRVLARDVSLALSEASGSSILNCLPAVVEELLPDIHPAQLLVRVKIGEAPLLARITRKSAALLQLAPGQPVWAQIKAAALL